MVGVNGSTDSSSAQNLCNKTPRDGGLIAVVNVTKGGERPEDDPTKLSV